MENIEGKRFLVKVPDLLYNQIISTKETKKIGYIDIIPGTYHPTMNLKLDKKAISFKAHNFSISLDPSDNYITFKDKKNKATLVKKFDYFGRLIANSAEESDNIAKELTKRENDEIIGTAKMEEIDRRQQNLEKLQEIKNNNEKNNRLKKDISLKKTRMPENELKNELFDLFGHHNYLTAKEIQNKTNQPEIYLKDVLKEICDYVQSGVNKGCYHLKSKYVGNDIDYEQNDDKELSDDE